MTPDDFRKFGHHLIDWLADYHAGVEERPVMAQVKPGARLGDVGHAIQFLLGEPHRLTPQLRRMFGEKMLHEDLDVFLSVSQRR